MNINLPAINSMIAQISPPSQEDPRGQTSYERGKNFSYSFHNYSTQLDRTVKNDLEKLWDWVNEEDFTVCPICNAPFKYPGADASKCERHGWIESRRTKLEDLCRTPLRLTGKKKAIKLSELTEEMARVALLTLRGGRNEQL